VREDLPEIKKEGEFGRKIHNKLLKSFPSLGEKPLGNKSKKKAY